MKLLQSFSMSYCVQLTKLLTSQGHVFDQQYCSILLTGNLVTCSFFLVKNATFLAFFSALAFCLASFLLCFILAFFPGQKKVSIHSIPLRDWGTIDSKELITPTSQLLPIMTAVILKILHPFKYKTQCIKIK